MADDLHSKNGRLKHTKLNPLQRQRKREVDREAQRLIRERRNNYIAHLENLVTTLQSQGGRDVQVEDLVSQIKKKNAEISQLREALSGITKIVNTLSYSTKAESRRAELPSANKPTQSEQSCTQTPMPFTQTPQEVATRNLACLDQSECRRSNIPKHDEPTWSSSSSQYKASPSPDGMRNFASQAMHESLEWSLPTTNIDCSYPARTEKGNSIENTLNEIASSILQRHDLEGKLWYLAGCLLNQVLSRPQGTLQYLISNEDIPVRAVVEGWPAVIRKFGPLDLGWQWLQQVDQALYASQGIPERLAILRLMRLQYEHQAQPNIGASQDRPAFMFARPTQEYLAHDALLEHYVWPGLRERVLLYPHKYATNKFMNTFRSHLRFVWPFAPSKCYNKDPTTSLYSYSNSFKSRQADLRCWSQRSDFFEVFPELQEDIPTFDQSLPRALINFKSGWMANEFQEAEEDNVEREDAHILRDRNQRILH